MAIQATGQTALATTKPREMTQREQQFSGLKHLLANNLKSIMAALPSHMKPERLARIVMTTVQKNPKLLECTQESFLGCVLSCAALGLEPDGLMGQAYLVPFREGRTGKTICTLIPGYKGLIKLARQSGEVSTIDAHEVRIGDAFDYRYGSEPFLRHQPAECPIIDVPTGKGDETVKAPDRNWRPGEITHFYAITKLRDGTVQFVVMRRWEVDEIRDGSQNYQASKKAGFDSAWDTDYPEMGKKTAIRRLSKMIPASVEKDNLLQKAVAIDERADRGLGQNLDEVHMVDIDLPNLPEPTPEPAQPAEEGKRTKLDGGQPASAAPSDPPEQQPEPPATPPADAPKGQQTLGDVAAQSKAGRAKGKERQPGEDG